MSLEYDPSCGAWDGGKGMAGEFVYNSTNDRYYVGDGCGTYSVYARYPALRPLYTDFEISFNALPFVNWAADNMHLPVVFSFVYIIFVFLGQRLMANCKARKSSLALFSWNALLAVFSIIGFLRTAPHLISFLYDYGFRASICAPAIASFGMGSAGLWSFLFIMSKVPELIDTVFLVLNKKPVIFLHWFHHATVLLYSWHAYGTRNTSGIWFIAMNYGVHALMYTYYALKQVKYAPLVPAANAILSIIPDKLVTSLQILQMIVGATVCIMVDVYTRRIEAIKRGEVVAEEGELLICDVTQESRWSGFAIYGSYFLLFAHFALKRYCGFGRKPAASKKKTA